MAAMSPKVGQRRLNGPQTTGREYRELSEPSSGIQRLDDVVVPMRDGTHLLADVHSPNTDGRFPALVSASCYPRQIQDIGAPMGFIEAGATDFFVPRGYVHVIANVRGTGQSGGEFTFFDGVERRDMHDLVEWAAAQSWVRWHRGHARHQLLRDDAARGSRRAAAAPAGDPLGGYHRRSVRGRVAPRAAQRELRLPVAVRHRDGR